jgi:hypothetical protein
VSGPSFAGRLADLEPGELTALLEHRPDTLVEPAPRTFAELAQRLDAFDSLAVALERVNADEVAVIRAVALGAGTVAELAARCRAPVDQVRGVVDGLGERGLAWRLDERVGLPKRLAADFAADVHAFLPLSALANRTRVDDLRIAVEGLGGNAACLRKAELVDLLTALYGDTALIARVIAELPTAARAHLKLLATPGGLWDGSWDGGFGLRLTGPTAALVHAGLLLQAGYGPPVLPREVVLARAVGDRLRGRPELAASEVAPDDGRAGAEAALLALTTLLDEARHRPLAALKKGGIGTRERTRLSGKVGIVEPALWIDVAAGAGFLERTTTGYGAAAGYDVWRGDGCPPVGRGRAGLVHAGRRADEPETDDGEVPRRSRWSRPPEWYGARCCGRRRAAARSQR